MRLPVAIDSDSSSFRIPPEAGRKDKTKPAHGRPGSETAEGGRIGEIDQRGVRQLRRRLTSPKERRLRRSPRIRRSRRRHGCKALAEELSRQGAGRDRAADRLDRRPSGQGLQAICGAARLHLHGQVDQLRRPRAPVGRVRRMAAVERSRQGRARRDHDAERAAISGRDDGHPARRLHRGERQPALHAARTRAPVEGFRRGGDRHPRKLRQDAAGGDCKDAGQACRGRDHGRHARRQGPDRQFRRQAGEEAGAGHGRCRAMSPSTPRSGTAPAGSSSRSRSTPRTSRSCNIPAARPACRRARRCSTATSSPTSTQISALGGGRLYGQAEAGRTRSSSARCRSITSSR